MNNYIQDIIIADIGHYLGNNFKFNSCENMTLYVFKTCNVLLPYKHEIEKIEEQLQEIKYIKKISVLWNYSSIYVSMLNSIEFRIEIKTAELISHEKTELLIKKHEIEQSLKELDYILDLMCNCPAKIANNESKTSLSSLNTMDHNSVEIVDDIDDYEWEQINITAHEIQIKT